MPPQTLVSGASLKLPQLPAVPQVTDAQTGLTVPQQVDPAGTASKLFIQQQLDPVTGLGATYNAQKTGAAARATQGLAGMGGYTVGPDGSVTYDASQAGTGALEKSAVQGQRSAANSRGTLYSSFTDTGISAALGRLSLTAQGVVNQYADQLAGYLGTASASASNLYGQWADLTGKDAAFQTANPPPGVVPPALAPPLPLPGMPAPPAPAPPALRKVGTAATSAVSAITKGTERAAYPYLAAQALSKGGSAAGPVAAVTKGVANIARLYSAPRRVR
jgi:hypothetical protein